MGIVRLLVAFLALAAPAAAGAQAAAQPQAAQRRGSAELPPASGSWADSGLVVAAGDRLTFRASPAQPMSLRFNAPPQPSYRARIGGVEFPISLNAPVLAPAAGSLELEVQYPQFPQVPPSRWPHIVMTVIDEPRPVGAGPPTKNPPHGTEGAPAGNQVAGVRTDGGGRDTGPVANRMGPIGDRVSPAPPPRARDPDWTLIALAAAGLAVALGTALALHLTANGPIPAPAVTIDPSLDTAEGGTKGDAIVADGPEVRLRVVLELGETRFEGGEPEVSGEVRNG